MLLQPKPAPAGAIRRVLIGLAGVLLAALLAFGPLAGGARADVADDPPARAPKEESAPFWVWLLPPAGLIIGLTAGARLRSRHDRKKPKG